jgi:prevent-host-death family protein
VPMVVCKVLHVVTKTVLPVQVFRDLLSDHLERVAYKNERFVVTRNGKPRAALVSLEDLAKLEQLEAKAKPTKGK